ncbi:MAG: EAL domain-containing protein, partial [Thermoanaerobaculia bacterium]
LISGDAPESLQLEASERGAVAFLQKPFEVRELDATLDMMTCSALSSTGDYGPVIRMPLLDDILSSGNLHSFFQPIVTLGSRTSVFGYESLARFRSESPMRNPDMLFKYAGRKKRIAELEFACIGAALREGAGLASTGLLFLNIHPDVFISGTGLRNALVSHSETAGVSRDRVVLEITEQSTLSGAPAVLATISELRKLGFRFAFDDIGVAASHLPLIDHVRPSFLKISQDFGTAFEADSTRTKIVTNLLSLARDFDCQLILEGIEHQATADAAAALGIPLGQGYFFGHPADASTFLK